MIRNLEKHQKYKTAYKPNDFFWGLGVEHETYLETSKLKQITPRDLKEYKEAERYCVEYYNVYNPEIWSKAIDGLFDQQQKILIPILANSHTLQKTDINGEHQQTFERIPKLNPNFNGKTIIELAKETNPDFFLKEYEKSYIFDGDTIEFMTQNFYKTTVNKVLQELTTVEQRFIVALNALPKEGILKTYGPFQLAQKNYPFASYLTNLKNNAMFNNGTIHINVTLPTKLNASGEIEDFELFKAQHQSYARAIQWISPLILAKYGAYDPLAESSKNGDKYAAGSQRVAVSRYIGLGTYDTDKMEVGKILTKKRDTLENIEWYKSFHQKADYKFLDDLGMDINFNKHFCHGLEFRILESVPIQDLKDILKLLVYLADFSLEHQVNNPTKSSIWHKIAENCVHNGKGYYMDVSDQNDLYRVFEVAEFAKEHALVTDVLTVITNYLKEKYRNGLCARYMIRGEQPPSIEPVKEQVPIVQEAEIVTPTKKGWCC